MGFVARQVTVLPLATAVTGSLLEKQGLPRHFAGAVNGLTCVLVGCVADRKIRFPLPDAEGVWCGLRKVP